MSRIEEALEKAAQLRNKEATGTEGKQPAEAGEVLLRNRSTLAEALEKAARLRSENRIFTDEFTRPQPFECVTVSDQFVVALNAPESPVAEEYRKLKSSIVKLTKGEPLKNMLMVTSALSSEGKSLTALNLAIALAQEYDHTVLLVDADLRKPTLHSYLGLDARPGLSECLLDELPLKDVLIRTDIGKLSLLPAGRAVPAPAELFSSKKIRDFFLEIKQRYPDRYVIIDTAPILPFAETRSISSIIDGIVLVIKEGAVPLDNVLQTLECLKGSTILGVVYNQAAADVSFSSNYFRKDR